MKGDDKNMKKTFKMIFCMFLCVFSLFIKNDKVYAYFSDSYVASNGFSVAPTYTDTFITNYSDSNGVITELGRETKKYFENTVVTINSPSNVNLTGLELDSITVNGSGSYNIGDTFTQLASNMTIVYTYKSSGYSVTYSGDTTNYTYSNTNLNVNNNDSYTTTITPVTGRDIDTVTVTMGGVDITSMYNTSNRTLTINQVTGNIEINVTTKLKTYTITYSGSNYTHTNNATTITHGSTYTATVTASNNYTINSITVNMGGTNITSSAVNNNQINIASVTGNITINVTTQSSGGGTTDPCLVEGTKVLLYDGSTKNIEDIRYNDLLKVWNHDLGKYDYEYAGWIEKASTTNSYTKITFEDGTILKIVGGHSLFSKKLNKYVNVTSGELEIGDEVVKLNNGIEYVRVSNIEVVNEEVKYYHVISTRYFNLIANNILTTYEIFDNISNFMDFGENLKWQNTEIVRSDMYTYNDFTYLPRYIYKAFRLEETKYLVNSGLVSPDEFTYLFTQYLTDENKMLMPPTNNNETRLWMVTTSDDTDLSNTTHQLEEGTIYTVPTPNNEEGFINWYNSSDNKYYNPGDTIEVYGGMHLTAIYE